VAEDLYAMLALKKSSLMKIKWTEIGLAINCGSE
jgi:hypothetical protein